MATQSKPEGITEKSQELGVKIILDNKELAKASDIIFIATKPNQALYVIEEIKPYINENKLIVSICAGITTSKLEAGLPPKTRVIRVMPNTPALVGEGMSGMIGGKYATEKDLEFVKNLLSTIGKCIIVDSEGEMDIVTAISGSGPAFFYKVINEIARAGEQLGLEYEKSLLLSIQTAIGSAKMALNRDISMEQLISNVATKGGCTAVGVDYMNSSDTAKLFYNVISGTTKKANELGK
jgi:pyrroline-5-carboxylate reductase